MIYDISKILILVFYLIKINKKLKTPVQGGDNRLITLFINSPLIVHHNNNTFYTSIRHCKTCMLCLVSFVNYL